MIQSRLSCGLEMEERETELVPGLPNEAALQCLVRLPLDAVARCRAVSPSWAAALRHYSSSALLFPSRPPLALACLCTAHVDHHRHSSWSWLFLSPSHLTSHLVPFYHILPSPALPTARLHAYSSQTQVMATGTNLLLVRSRLRLTGRRSSGANKAPVLDQLVEDGSMAAAPGYDDEGPGALQGFDVWQMKWCRDLNQAVPRMKVDRWGFATGWVGKYVYVAGGEGPGAARSAERLDMEKGQEWEELAEMKVERGVNPAGFVKGGRFYVAGGEFQPTTSTEGRGLVQSGEYYEAEEGQWKVEEGMWPEALWGCAEGEPHVAVLQDVAYKLSTVPTSTEVMMMVDAEQGWQVRGHLPDPPGFDPLERWYMHLVAVNNEELWLLVSGKSTVQPWLVFACRPHATTADDGLLHWQPRPFTVPKAARSGVLASLGNILV